MTKIGTYGHGYFDRIGFPSALLQAGTPNPDGQADQRFQHKELSNSPTTFRGVVHGKEARWVCWISIFSMRIGLIVKPESESLPESMSVRERIG